MDSPRFQHLESLHWLWVVAAIALVVVLGWRARRIAMAKFAEPGLWSHLIPDVSRARPLVRGVLLTTAALFLVISLLDPRWGVRYEEIQRRGIDILFVVDVSRSMLAEDVKPNRLGRAKQCISDVVEELGGDRVGLVSFAGIAALKCPLTIDYGAFRLSLNELAPESAARGGSLVGDALRLAGDCFTGEASDAKVIVLISDGEDQASYPVEAARTFVQDQNVHIFTLGLGDSNEGSRIPIQTPQGRKFVMYQGQEVWSKLDHDLMREIALAGNGAYIPAGTSSVDLAAVYREKIAPMSTRQVESGRIEIREPKYQWFAGTALALLLIESWMSNRTPRAKSWSEQLKPEQSP